MRENRLKTLWGQGRAATNCWLTIPSHYVAEAMAHQEWDTATIDMQHGMIGMEDAYAMMAAMSGTNCVPIVRVPWNEPGIIMRALDGGAYGIICPMINSAEECERFVGACRYAPTGYRSVGPNRAVLYGGADYLAKANDTIVTFGMIETKQALDNLEAICKTPGLDAVLIGPADLGLSLGREPRADQTDETVVQAIDHILTTAKAHGLRAAIVNGSVEYSQKMVKKGFDLVTVTSDMGLLRGGTAKRKAMLD